MHKRKHNQEHGELKQMLLTVAQAAVVLGVSRSKVYQLVKENSLPYVKFGKSDMRILRTSLEQWAKDHETYAFL